MADIDAGAITGYVVKPKGMGKASGTINIELATLKKALRPAQEHGKLAMVPAIRMLKPNAPQSGFFEPEQFQAVSEAFPRPRTCGADRVHVWLGGSVVRC